MNLEVGLLSFFLLSHVRLGDPMDCILQALLVHRISEARILEWVAKENFHIYRGLGPQDEGEHVEHIHPTFISLETADGHWH